MANFKLYLNSGKWTIISFNRLTGKLPEINQIQCYQYMRTIEKRTMKMNLLINILISILFFSCGSNIEKESKSQSQNLNTENPIDNEIGINDLTDTLIVNGFDFPVGNPNGKGQYTSKTDGKTYDSWYNATKFAEKYSLGIHTGIDLNGTGGGDTDKGQPVYAISKGIIEVAKNFGSPWGNVVIIKHKYLENGHINYCYSLYAHMEDLLVKKGDLINKRAQIGVIGTGGGSYPAHLHLEIRKNIMKDYEATYWPSSHSKSIDWVKEYYEDTEEFINKHRVTTCPYLENKIIIALKSKYKLFYFENGEIKNEYEIALSQNPIGHKEKEGDLRLPEGEYYISKKQTGPFFGNYSKFLGNRIIGISYPNTYDANTGYKKGIITKTEKENIIHANLKKITPPKTTKIGGGIAIHGWNGEWIADGNQNLTWGCISMHNKDLESFYDIVQLKTIIIILQ